MKRAIIVGLITAFVMTEMVLAPAPAEAQQKGQSISVQHGIVVKSERVDISENKAPAGVAVGGTIGLMTGGSSGYKRRRNAAIGAAAGGLLGAAGSTQQMGMMYTVETASGLTKVVTDQTEIHMGDCVVVEMANNRANVRRVNREVFETLSFGLLNRRRLRIRHLRRQTGQETERLVSPQRLVHYRYNWYLDTWCHTRNDIRIFAVDAISAAQALGDAAREVPDERLDEVLRAGYGIFAGQAVDRAVLRFTPSRARWVASEAWHSQQVGRIEADGSYVLEVPYSQEPELVMDILKYGSDVEVLSPPSLRQRVADELAAAASRYAG